MTISFDAISGMPISGAPISGGAGGSTGTVSATLDSLTSSASGTTTIVGVLAVTLATLTSSVSGTTTVLGSSSNTLDALTSSISGTVGGGSVSGTVSATLSDLTSSISGTTTVVGSSSSTISNLTSSASGTVGGVTLTDADVDMIWNEDMGEGYTARQLMRIFSAVLAGKVSGAGTSTEIFRAINDSKDRVTASVDSNGNRTSITLDAS